jgi:hypothetical protein
VLLLLSRIVKDWKQQHAGAARDGFALRKGEQSSSIKQAGDFELGVLGRSKALSHAVRDMQAGSSGFSTPIGGVLDV